MSKFLLAVGVIAVVSALIAAQGTTRPRPDPETTRPRPDPLTTRPRPDPETTRPHPSHPETTRPRPDTTRPRPDTTRVMPTMPPHSTRPQPTFPPRTTRPHPTLPPRTTRPAPARSIAVTECEDHECKVGCRTVAKIAENKCRSEAFRKDRSVIAKCAPAPDALCYYVGMFGSANDTANATTADCTDDLAKMVDYKQCGVCQKNNFGHYEITRNCSTTVGSNMTVSMGCDATCTTCKHTFTVRTGVCFVPEHFNKVALYNRVPVRCAKRVITTTYNESASCDGASSSEDVFEGVCKGSRGHSHYIRCQ